MARCEGNNIQILDKIFFPNSLGHFIQPYVNLLVYRYGEEYKVMDWSYGEPNYINQLSKIISIKNNRFVNNKNYFEVAKGFSELSDNILNSGRFYSSIN